MKAGETETHLKNNILETREFYKVAEQASAVANDKDGYFTRYLHSVLSTIGGSRYEVLTSISSESRHATMTIDSMLRGFSPTDHASSSRQHSDLPTYLDHPASRLPVDTKPVSAQKTIKQLVVLGEAEQEELQGYHFYIRASHQGHRTHPANALIRSSIRQQCVRRLCGSPLSYVLQTLALGTSRLLSVMLPS